MGGWEVEIAGLLTCVIEMKRHRSGFEAPAGGGGCRGEHTSSPLTRAHTAQELLDIQGVACMLRSPSLPP